MNKKWDLRFLDLAQHIAQWSKDPSTKVGAVIVRPDKTICSVGYNGFPRGIEDTEERLNNRDLKYPCMVHAEMNAILNSKESLDGYILYISSPTYFAPTCDRCAVHIIQRIRYSPPVVKQPSHQEIFYVARFVGCGP